jgi:hypothetical protein
LMSRNVLEHDIAVYISDGVISKSDESAALARFSQGQ